MPEEHSASTRGSATLAAIIAVAALLGVAVVWMTLDERVRGLEILTSSYEPIGLVDLAEPTIQDLEQAGFFVASLAVKEHLTGVKITGRMINTQSVDHTDVTFELTVGEESKQFTINRVSSGNSTGFSVYLPDVPKEDARWGVFERRSSMIFFLTK
jgi:hypothetical protein